MRGCVLTMSAKGFDTSVRDQCQHNHRHDRGESDGNVCPRLCCSTGPKLNWTRLACVLCAGGKRQQLCSTHTKKQFTHINKNVCFCRVDIIMQSSSSSTACTQQMVVFFPSVGKAIGRCRDHLLSARTNKKTHIYYINACQTDNHLSSSTKHIDIVSPQSDEYIPSHQRAKTELSRRWGFKCDCALIGSDSRLEFNSHAISRLSALAECPGA